MLIAVADGLKGFPEAITAAFPQATVQTCIVHLVRRSLNFCASKDRKAQSSGRPSPGLFSDPPHTADLRRIYQAPTADQAAVALDAFGAASGDKYASIASAWRRAWGRAWEEVTPLFAFPPTVRKIIYTTTAIEGLNRVIRKSIKTRGSFPTEDAATKLICEPSATSRKAAEMSGNGLQRATNSISCSRNASMNDRG